MRPDLLNPLFSPVTSLAGVGPKVAENLSKLLGVTDDGEPPRVLDLLMHVPVTVIDRSQRPSIADAPHGEIATLRVHVDRHQPSPRGNRRIPYRVYCHDDSGTLSLTYFHARGDWLQRLLPPGSERIVSGRVEWFNERVSMVHPDHVVDPSDMADLPLIEPVYPMTAGLARKTLLRAIRDALDGLPDLPEWIDPDTMAEERWPSATDALRAMHRPEAVNDLAPEAPARRRLAFDELLASQLAIALMRAHQQRDGRAPRTIDGRMRDAIVARLPFALTGAQQRAVAAIENDLREPDRMLRLLQGDVGSGKTVVALLAAAGLKENGAQTALMAPTELLARQHARTLAGFAEPAGMTIAVLTGREKGAERRAILQGLGNGEIDLVAGTHALFQSGVAFANLGLVVVDEQHRFGVHQRLSLATKGEAADVLVMTATPIPRTLVMTYYGDMDVSRLDEKPPGRQPIETRAIPAERLDQIVGRLHAALERGDKAYWICPLVEDSDVSDLTSAEERYRTLKEALGDNIGLVHGRMKPSERDRVMEAFRDGSVRVLVATTVVEVGVDVPDATIMIVEHADRFGLAQLHQLRGRVGRGDRKSSCLLLFRQPLGEVARQRLDILRESEDGFRIAEEDLRLRGGGEVLGTRQSGLPGFRFARTEVDTDLMEMAHAQARHMVERNPDLTGEHGAACRMLLYLFGRDAAIRLLRAG